MNDLSNNLQETANCYIISEQGNYEFPLVYGCGFMNGKENPRSYAGDNFLDYNGEIINTPEIPYKIKEAKIISWDSDPEIIKNITIKENYIKFNETNKTDRPKQYKKMNVPQQKNCDKILTSNEYNSDIIGAKAVNLKRLEELSKSKKIHSIIPKSIALPNNYIEKLFTENNDKIYNDRK